jgi:hypothetical protein
MLFVWVGEVFVQAFSVFTQFPLHTLRGIRYINSQAAIVTKQQ